MESIGFEAELLEDLAECSGARASLQLLVTEGDAEGCLRGVEGLLELRRGGDTPGSARFSRDFQGFSTCSRAFPFIFGWFRSFGGL